MPQEFSIFIASKLFGDIKMFSHARVTTVEANGIRLQLFIAFMFLPPLTVDATRAKFFQISSPWLQEVESQILFRHQDNGPTQW